EVWVSKPFRKWMQTATPSEVRDAMDAMGEVRFMRGDVPYRQATAVELLDDTVESRKLESHLQKQLEKKAALVKEAEPIYLSIIEEIDSPRWGLAAIVRLGMMYENIASELLTTPCPP